FNSQFIDQVSIELCGIEYFDIVIESPCFDDIRRERELPADRLVRSSHDACRDEAELSKLVQRYSRETRRAEEYEPCFLGGIHFCSSAISSSLISQTSLALSVKRTPFRWSTSCWKICARRPLAPRSICSPFSFQAFNAAFSERLMVPYS